VRLSRLVDKVQLAERIDDVLQFGGFVTYYEMSESERDELVDSISDEVYAFLSELDTDDLGGSDDGPEDTSSPEEQ